MRVETRVSRRDCAFTIDPLMMRCARGESGRSPVTIGASSPRGQRAGECGFQFRGVSVAGFQDVRGFAVRVQQAKKKMLGADEILFQLPRGNLGGGERLSICFGECFSHGEG